MTEPALPRPDALQLEHSQRLRDRILSRVRDGGLSFAEYMQQALYEPGLGYYMAGAQKFGQAGDFITAPEVSPLFGQTLAAQCREVLDALDAGADERILEFGAGSGALATAVLGALSDRQQLKYLIIETSPELIQRQRDAIEAALGAAGLARVEWLSALPTALTGVVIANEVVDALPVERFIKRSNEVGDVWQIGTVARSDTDDVAFADDLRPSPDDLTRAVQAIEADLEQALPTGYASEVNLHARPWLTSVGASLARGVVLLVDYGYPRAEYYSVERGSGTLACYYRHRAHDDAYRWPGLQDITAHVDFTMLAESAEPAGLDFLGYTSQAAFLLANGVLQLAEDAVRSIDSEIDRIAVSRAVKTLTLPGEMGERFQVLALGKVYDHPLRGFSLQDLSHRL